MPEVVFLLFLLLLFVCLFLSFAMCSQIGVAFVKCYKMANYGIACMFCFMSVCRLWIDFVDL